MNTWVSDPREEQYRKTCGARLCADNTYLVVFSLRSVRCHQIYGQPHLTLAYFLSVYSEPYWLAYVVTTYSTSFIWFAFLFTVFATAQLKRLSAILSHLLESKWVAELPILMMVGLLCMLCWPALLIANLVSPYGG